MVVVAESELAVVMTVPVTFGNVIVRSAVGSTTVRVVSLASSVAPSKIIAVENIFPASRAVISLTSVLN